MTLLVELVTKMILQVAMYFSMVRLGTEGQHRAINTAIFWEKEHLEKSVSRTIFQNLCMTLIPESVLSVLGESVYLCQDDYLMVGQGRRMESRRMESRRMESRSLTLNSLCPSVLSW